MVWIRKPQRIELDLSAQLAAGWTGGTVTARRSGDTVMVEVQSLARSEAATGTTPLLVLQKGLKPAGNLYGESFRGYRTRCLSSGVLSIDGPGVSLDYLHFTFLTLDSKDDL